MISFKIKEINKFMHELLIAGTFDNFLLCDGEICTATAFTINGHFNKNFFSENELNTMNDDFSTWKNIRHIAFEIIKGDKVPSKMKLVLALSKTKYEEIIAKSGMDILSSDVGGLYIHVLYENDSIEIITGTSLNTFTLDKTLDKYWDKTVINFFESKFNCELL